MRPARLTLLLPVALLAALVATPAVVLAADTVTVTGMVVRDGSPVTGVGIVVSVTGMDEAVSAATDEQGAFTLELEARIGDELQVYASGGTSTSGPDARGCVHSETPIGRLRTTIEAIPPAPLTVMLDQVLTDTVCKATPTPTATPRVTPPATATPRVAPPATPAPRVTPPATDATVSRPASSGSGLWLALWAIALATTGALVAVRRRA